MDTRQTPVGPRAGGGPTGKTTRVQQSAELPGLPSLEAGDPR
jgi:hypothetical protein